MIKDDKEIIQEERECTAWRKSRQIKKALKGGCNVIGEGTVWKKKDHQ